MLARMIGFVTGLRTRSGLRRWSGVGRKKPLKDWKVDEKRAARTRSEKGFTFATIDGGGHMVSMSYVRWVFPAYCASLQAPHDKPKEFLELV